MDLKIEHISKQFKDKTAVDDVSLTLTTGVWGLLGANGAGKTTLMRILADIMTPSSGRISLDGKDIHKMGADYRNIFGFLPQDFGYSRDFTVKDYLEYVAALKDVPLRETTKKINYLLDILTLSDVKRKKIAQLSGGMKRRVGIAQAMLNDPKILVMDEPTAGLDPGERVRFRNFISEFSHDRIVLISTHIVSDIEYIATRNAIMKSGKIIDEGTTSELVLADVLIRAEDNRADQLFLQVLRHALHAAREFEQLACHAVFKAMDMRDTVTDGVVQESENSKIRLFA